MTATLSVKQANLIMRETEKYLHLIQFRICELEGEPVHGSPMRMHCETLEQCFVELSFVKKEYDAALNTLRELEEKISERDRIHSERILNMSQDIGVPVHAVLVENLYQKAQSKSESKTLDLDVLSEELVLECERAIKQRDEFFRTGVSTASHGGSHDTCFPAILRKHLGHLVK